MQECHSRVLHGCGRLTEVSGDVGALVSLRNLNLAHNSLIWLPAAVGQLTALRRLDLRHNQLQSLPDELGGCSALEELDAAENSLAALPESLGRLQNLRSLLLDKNRSERIHKTCNVVLVSISLSFSRKPVLIPAVS